MVPEAAIEVGELTVGRTEAASLVDSTAVGSKVMAVINNNGAIQH